MYIYIYIYVYIYIYIYTRTSRPFRPLVLVVAFGLHRGLCPLPAPIKVPIHPKISRGIAKCIYTDTYIYI